MEPERKIVRLPETPDFKALRPYMDRIIQAIAVDQPHVARAFYTSRSRIADFYLVDPPPEAEIPDIAISEGEYRVQLGMLAHRLGVEVDGLDFLVDVARQLQNRDKVS